jgi:hypothetical protein
MGKRMRKMVVKDDLDNNPTPTKKVRRERIPPSAAMTLPRAVFGADLIEQRKGGRK